MNCHLLRCFCPQLGDKEHKHKKGKAEDNDERHWGNIQITISAELVAGQKDNYIGSTVIVSQCHSVLHVPGELTLIILLSLFFCLFYTLYIPFTFIIFCPSLFFCTFSCLITSFLSMLILPTWPSSLFSPGLCLGVLLEVCGGSSPLSSFLLTQPTWLLSWQWKEWYRP